MTILNGLQALFGGDVPSSRNREREEHRHQTDVELRKRNARLKELLEAANAKIAQLESLIKSMKEESILVEKALMTRREEFAQFKEDVSVQMQQVEQSLDEKMQQFGQSLDAKMQQMEQSFDVKMEQFDQSVEAKMQKLNESMDEKMQQLDEIKAVLTELQEKAVSIDHIAEKTEELKIEIVEKIHSENVKCYRNMKSLVTDLEVKMEQMELGEESLIKIRKSFKGIKFFSFFAFLNFIAVTFYILYTMGYFPF